MIRRLDDTPKASIHPEDAQKRDIREGQQVRIFNDRGSFEVEATLDFGIKPGCISVANGWWITDGGAVNFCSLGRETDMGHGAAFHDNLVEVEAAKVQAQTAKAQADAQVALQKLALDREKAEADISLRQQKLDIDAAKVMRQ